MPRHNDPAELNPEERLDELASIFATALLRLPPRTRAVLAASQHEGRSIENSAQKALEVSATLRPDPLGI